MSKRYAFVRAYRAEQVIFVEAASVEKANEIAQAYDWDGHSVDVGDLEYQRLSVKRYPSLDEKIK